MSMAASVCPACHAPIDPARAPVARVRGTRVVTFCSTACADAPASDAAPLTMRVDGPGQASEALAGAAETADERRARRLAQVELEPDYVRPRGNRKRQIMALSATIMAGGMAITIINAVSPSTPTEVSAAGTRRTAAMADQAGLEQGAPLHSREVDHAVLAGNSPARPASESPAGETPAGETPASGPAASELGALSPDALHATAMATLRELMASPSTRVQRIAAMALSRARDPDALALIRRMLDQETEELPRIELAYVLARSGDVDARKVLRRRLKHKLRDVRVDAARALVELGDDTGIEVLEQVLDLGSHKLGAAGLLARMGNGRGMAALRAELDDSTSSEETRIRAAVALGRAGDAGMRERLVAMLEDPRYHVGAADALAALGDRAAIPALERQLALPSLCVRAALGLRRMDASVDPGILLHALATGSDPVRVGAAEAIMILTGPRGLAERE